MEKYRSIVYQFTGLQFIYKHVVFDEEFAITLTYLQIDYFIHVIILTSLFPLLIDCSMKALYVMTYRRSVFYCSIIIHSSVHFNIFDTFKTTYHFVIGHNEEALYSLQIIFFFRGVLVGWISSGELYPGTMLPVCLVNKEVEIVSMIKE